MRPRTWGQSLSLAQEDICSLLTAGALNAGQPSSKCVTLGKAGRGWGSVTLSLPGREKQSAHPESQKHCHPRQAGGTSHGKLRSHPASSSLAPTSYLLVRPSVLLLCLSTVTFLVSTGIFFYRGLHWPSWVHFHPTPTHTPYAQKSQSDPLKIYIRSHHLPAQTPPMASGVWQGDFF